MSATPDFSLLPLTLRRLASRARAFKISSLVCQFLLLLFIIGIINQDPPVRGLALLCSSASLFPRVCFADILCKLTFNDFGRLSFLGFFNSCSQLVMCHRWKLVFCIYWLYYICQDWYFLEGSLWEGQWITYMLFCGFNLLMLADCVYAALRLVHTTLCDPEAERAAQLKA